MRIRTAFLIAAIGCALVASTTDAGSGTRYRGFGSTPSRLVIHRAANFGNNISVNVYIDGVLAGNVGYNHKFATNLPAGQHVIALEQVPRFGGAWQVSTQRINFAAGDTSVFTVVTADGGTRAVLDPS